MKIPVILHRDDYVIIKENDDFLRFSDGEIVIYRNQKEALKDLKNNERLVSCLSLSDQQKEIVKDNVRKYKYTTKKQNRKR